MWVVPILNYSKTSSDLILLGGAICPAYSLAAALSVCSTHNDSISVTHGCTYKDSFSGT